jgi:hypothetical protein
MAKNLFEQFISMFGDKLPGVHEEKEYPTYSRHSSGMTGVERYLARQTAAEQAAPALRTGATGVEKYLAKKALAEQEAAAQKGPTTSVDKYLAQQAAAEKQTTAARQPATRVEAYLAKQSGASAQPKTKVEKYLAEQAAAEQESAAKKEPATGVEKYLADQESAESDETATRVAKYLADHASSSPKGTAAIEEVVQQPEPVEGNTPHAPEISAPSSEATTQCQAVTGKGTQCTRTVNLTQIGRTIDGQDYQFTVCSQHDTQNFKPYSAFIEN